MKRFLVLLLMSLLAGSTVISQTSPETPELAEATELTKSVTKLFNEKKFDEALALAKRALEIRERLLPHNDPRVANSLSYLGDVYMAKREYDNARKTFERLLQVQEELVGPTDVRLANTFDRLALLYYEDSKPAKAEEFYQRALAVREKGLGPENVQVADTLYALGQFYRVRREYDRALLNYKRSLQIYGRAKGATTTEFQRAVTALSCLAYESQNNTIFKEIEEIQQQFAPGQPPMPFAKMLNGYAVHIAKPAYPQAARERKLSGTVVVLVEIDENGKVISAKDMCQGPPYLSESSVKAALQSTFAPTQISGVPVKTKGVLRFNFVYNSTIWRMNPTLP
ncbi:MAG TPA: TonB family protein [Pyrinomonadaceae bacterium]|nr:TonB family protein [Pyrinomonadaceae bacterium]